MAQKDMPQGFTVACIEGKWYPLEVSTHYSVDYPEGQVSALYTILHHYVDAIASFPVRKDAVRACQEQAQEREEDERHKWEQLTHKSNVFPERCSQYVSIIEDVIGHDAITTRFWDEVNVFVAASYCQYCKTATPCISASALTIEDALEEVAQEVYACRCQCKRMQETQGQLQLTA